MASKSLLYRTKKQTVEKKEVQETEIPNTSITETTHKNRNRNNKKDLIDKASVVVETHAPQSHNEEE